MSVCPALWCLRDNTTRKHVTHVVWDWDLGSVTHSCCFSVYSVSLIHSVFATKTSNTQTHLCQLNAAFFEV